MRKLLAIFSLAMMVGCSATVPTEDPKTAPKPAAVEEPIVETAEVPETAPESVEPASTDVE